MTEQNDKDLQLHCLVDSELARTEHAELMSSLDADDELRTRVCSLSHQKELVRMAYADVEEPTQQRHRNRPVVAIAASVVLAVVGALAYSNLVGIALEDPATRSGSDRIVLLDHDGSGKQLADPTRDETRIVFQLTNPDMAKAAEVLDEIEGVLAYHREIEKPIRVELVAHGEGLSIVRPRLSELADRIAEMNNRYENLTFVACNNTIERISNEQGFAVAVLPQVVVIQSGVNHVAQRQSQGWAYIHL